MLTWGLIFIGGFAVGLLGSAYFLDFYYRRELNRLEDLHNELMGLRLWRAAISFERSLH